MAWLSITWTQSLFCLPFFPYISLFICFSILICLLFFSFLCFTALSLALCRANHTLREESTISLIYLLCNPFLLLCSESVNLLPPSKQKIETICIYFFHSFETSYFRKNGCKTITRSLCVASPEINVLFVSWLGLFSSSLQWHGWLNSLLQSLSLKNHNQAHEGIIQYAAV